MSEVNSDRCNLLGTIIIILLVTRISNCVFGLLRNAVIVGVALICFFFTSAVVFAMLYLTYTLIHTDIAFSDHEILMAFLQAWLYFQLIFTQYDIREYKECDTVNEWPLKLSKDEDDNCAIIDILIFPRTCVTDGNNYLEENRLSSSSGYDNGNEVATWRLALACFVAFGIGLKMLFLFRTFTKIAVWTVLMLVTLLLAVVVVTFRHWDIQANPQHSRNFLMIIIFFTTVLPIPVVIVIYFFKKLFSLFYMPMPLLYNSLLLYNSIIEDISLSPVIAVLKESAMAIFSRPHIFIISILVFFVELLILFIFFATTMYMGSPGTLVELNEKYRIYKNNVPACFSVMLYACLTIWAIQCVTGLQNMMLLRATVRWYYSVHKRFLNSSIFTSFVFTCDSNVIALESMIMTIVATITSLLATYRRNFLVSYLPIYKKFMDFLYDKIYWFAGVGTVILFNLRVSAASLVSNVLVSIFFVLVVGALWCSQTIDDIVVTNKDFWPLPASFFILLAVLFSVVVMLQSKFGLVFVLLKKSVKATLFLPRTVIFSILFFLLQFIILVAFVTKIINVNSSGIPYESIQEYIIFYKYRAVLLFSMILNGCMTILVMKFIAEIQSMIITTAVANWYFSRNKVAWDKNVQSKYSSSLFEIHLGTIAFDSLLEFFNRNKNIPGFSIIKRCLIYLSNNGYISTGKNNSYYDTKDNDYVFQQMMDMAAINYIGYFVVFVIQQLIVFLSLLSTYLIIQNTDSSQQWDIYAIAGVISTVAAVTFFSSFQTVIDTILLCFWEDWLINDVMARPYSNSLSFKHFMTRTTAE